MFIFLFIEILIPVKEKQVLPRTVIIIITELSRYTKACNLETAWQTVVMWRRRGV